MAISIGGTVAGCQAPMDQQSPSQSLSGTPTRQSLTYGRQPTGIPTKFAPIGRIRAGGTPTSMMAGGVEMAGGTRIIVDSSSGSVFALNAYGGASDGGEVKLWENCPKDNPDCMWYFRHGMIVSARNSALAIRGLTSGNLTLDSNCTSDDKECQWLWHKGVLENVDHSGFAIKASAGPVSGGALVLDNGCTESDPNCTFTIESARMSSAADHRTGVYAGNFPFNGSAVQLAAIWPCPVSDSRCTWTLRQGLITTDSNPALAMRASAPAGWATVRLSNTCTGSDPQCTWTFDGKRLVSDAPFTGMSGPTSLAVVPINGPLLNLTLKKPLRLAPIGAQSGATKECVSSSPPGPACAPGYFCVSNPDPSPLPPGFVTNDGCVAECLADDPTNPACAFEVGSPVPIAWSGTAAPKAKWTLMVLHFTDGDYSYDVTWDEGRMGQSGSTPDVNIVALLDTPDYDRSNGRVPLYQGQGVYLRVNRNASPTILHQLGEINMGDPNVEGDFADFVATYFPADNYAVTTYDHGSGWGGFGMDLTGTGISNPSGDYAAMLSRMNSAFGQKVGVMGSDGCGVGTWEMAATSLPYAEYFVASEAGVGPTLNYAQFLPSLVTTPTMTALDLATEITTTFVWPKPPLPPQPLLETMAATDVSSAYLGPTGSLTTAISALGQALRDPAFNNCVSDARTAATHTGEIIGGDLYPDGIGYADIYSLADQIGVLCGSPAIQALATDVKNAVADSVNHAVVATNYGYMTPDPHGLAIYMPKRCEPMDPNYFAAPGALWSQQTEWDEFLRGFSPPADDMTKGESVPRPLPVPYVVARPLALLSAEVSWSPSPTYGSTYTVKRVTSPGAYPDSFVVPYVSGTVWTDTGLDSETRYYYVVVAGNCSQESDASPEVSVGPPSVAITSPANNAEFAAPATITITATASDPDVGDDISKVELYQGGILLGTDTTAPYTVTWSGAAEGTYLLTAKAYDLTGFVATSAPVSITVTANDPCAGLCSPWVVKPGPGIQQGYLGTGEICDQTLASLSGGNCGNMTGRIFQVNGVTMLCNGQTWATLPPKRNGGYCMHATAGGFAYAYYTTW